MPGRRERDLQRPVLETLPVTHFVNPIEAQVVHKIPNVLGNRDRLVPGDGPQGAPIQVVKMSMGDQHQIDGRKIVELDARMLDPLDDLEPLRPIRVD